jgi:hypothetical protein
MVLICTAILVTPYETFEKSRPEEEPVLTNPAPEESPRVAHSSSFWLEWGTQP